MELMFDLSNPYLDMTMLLNDLHIKVIFEFRDYKDKISQSFEILRR